MACILFFDKNQGIGKPFTKTTDQTLKEETANNNLVSLELTIWEQSEKIKGVKHSWWRAKLFQRQPQELLYTWV